MLKPVWAHHAMPRRLDFKIESGREFVTIVDSQIQQHTVAIVSSTAASFRASGGENMVLSDVLS